MSFLREAGVKVNYNYHTHTYRCHHATGSMEEYINRAIENGIKFFGFSDHIPFVCSNGEETFYRILTAEAEEYIAEATALREKFKDKIDIKIGFEMEYYPEHFEKMFENALKWGAEYLILGEHFLEEEQPDIKMKSMRAQSDSPKRLIKYTDCVIKAIKSGVFTYVAHPDIYNFTGDDDIYNEQARRICRASVKYNIPLEINFLGIRENRKYPDGRFWKVAGEEKAPVIFGFDAHDVLSAYDGESLFKAKEMVEKFGLNYIGKPKLIEIQKTGV